MPVSTFIPYAFTTGSTANVSGALPLMGCTIARNLDSSFSVNFGQFIPNPNATPLPNTTGDQDPIYSNVSLLPSGVLISQIPAFQSIITGATNASPIVITTATPFLATTLNIGQIVVVTNVAGNTAANSLPWVVSATSSNTITLALSAGNGVFINDGLGSVSGPWDPALRSQFKRTSVSMSIPAAFTQARDLAIQGLGVTNTQVQQYVYASWIAWLDFVRQGGS